MPGVSGLPEDSERGDKKSELHLDNRTGHEHSTKNIFNSYGGNKNGK